MFTENGVCSFCAGSWFPIPPNDVTVKLGFDYSTGELRLEITSSDLSPGTYVTIALYTVNELHIVYVCG